ncbi:MAG: hypothetical protein IJ428_01965 [Clostridia bacterium]|nr:hypothetical protein [Clostridia bacterium]
MSEEHGGFGRISILLREKKSLWLIAAALILGVCLMLLGGKDDDTAVATSVGVSELTDTSTLETKVKELCERIGGVSDVSVMITLDTLGEQLYAYNTQKSYDGDVGSERLEYVTTSQGVVPMGEVMPQVRGIAVVCTGGDDAGIKLKLTELLCALFSVPSSSVSIVGGK